MFRPARSLVATLLVLLAFAGRAVAAPDAVLWPRWLAHDAASTTVVDHSAWDRWLARYVTPDRDSVNRVAYARVGTDGRAALAAYIRHLAAVPVSHLARPEQMAYWINLYNAVTVKVVLDHYPVASILKIGISPGWFSTGPWGAKLVTVEGEKLSLDDIEHRILRPIWHDPRVHYAVNCASLGCPNLRREAYVGARIDAQLDDQAHAYVNSPHGGYFDHGSLYLSSIYDWYGTDFGGTDASVIAHLRRYATGERAAKLAHATHIAGYFYDWALNDVATAP